MCVKKIVFVFLVLLMSSALFAAEPFQFTEDGKNKQLVLIEGKAPLLTYQFDAIKHDFVPEKSARQFAGCYIHPLHGLKGEVLTDNAPKDHYHHHGVFWTYPHVGVHEKDGKVKEYDLWQGTKYPALKQRFVRWLDKKTANDTAIIEAENGWFITAKDHSLEPENKIMKECVKITVHRIQTVAGVRGRAVEVELYWQPTEKPISLRGAEGKSYGGLTVRLKPFVQEKNRNRSDGAVHDEVNVITTPKGVAKGDLPDTPLPWADYTSCFASNESKEKSGVAVFVSKDHPAYPPTWLVRYYGPLCVGYPGVKAKVFQPGEEIKLRYILWIHEGSVNAEQLENAYKFYTSPVR
jgi:hypothetical protein